MSVASSNTSASAPPLSLRAEIDNQRRNANWAPVLACAGSWQRVMAHFDSIIAAARAADTHVFALHDTLSDEHAARLPAVRAELQKLAGAGLLLRYRVAATVQVNEDALLDWGKAFTPQWTATVLDCQAASDELVRIQAAPGSCFGVRERLLQLLAHRNKFDRPGAPCIPCTLARIGPDGAGMPLPVDDDELRIGLEVLGARLPM